MMCVVDVSADCPTCKWNKQGCDIGVDIALPRSDVIDANGFCDHFDMTVKVPV